MTRPLSSSSGRRKTLANCDDTFHRCFLSPKLCVLLLKGLLPVTILRDTPKWRRAGNATGPASSSLQTYLLDAQLFGELLRGVSSQLAELPTGNLEPLLSRRRVFQISNMSPPYWRHERPETVTRTSGSLSRLFCRPSGQINFAFFCGETLFGLLGKVWPKYREECCEKYCKKRRQK